MLIMNYNLQGTWKQNLVPWRILHLIPFMKIKGNFTFVGSTEVLSFSLNLKTIVGMNYISLPCTCKPSPFDGIYSPFLYKLKSRFDRSLLKIGFSHKWAGDEFAKK